MSAKTWISTVWFPTVWLGLTLLGFVSSPSFSRSVSTGDAIDTVAISQELTEKLSRLGLPSVWVHVGTTAPLFTEGEGDEPLLGLTGSLQDLTKSSSKNVTLRNDAKLRAADVEVFSKEPMTGAGRKDLERLIRADLRSRGLSMTTIDFSQVTLAAVESIAATPSADSASQAEKQDWSVLKPIDYRPAMKNVEISSGQLVVLIRWLVGAIFVGALILAAVTMLVARRMVKGLTALQESAQIRSGESDRNMTAMTSTGAISPADRPSPAQLPGTGDSSIEVAALEALKTDSELGNMLAQHLLTSEQYEYLYLLLTRIAADQRHQLLNMWSRNQSEDCEGFRRFRSQVTPATLIEIEEKSKAFLHLVWVAVLDREALLLTNLRSQLARISDVGLTQIVAAATVDEQHVIFSELEPERLAALTIDDQVDINILAAWREPRGESSAYELVSRRLRAHLNESIPIVDLRQKLLRMLPSKQEAVLREVGGWDDLPAMTDLLRRHEQACLDWLRRLSVEDLSAIGALLSDKYLSIISEELPNLAKRRLERLGYQQSRLSFKLHEQLRTYLESLEAQQVIPDVELPMAS